MKEAPQTDLSTASITWIILLVVAIGVVSWFAWDTGKMHDIPPQAMDHPIQSIDGAYMVPARTPQPQHSPANAIITEYKAGTIYNLQLLTGGDTERAQVGAVGRYCLSITPASKKDSSIVVTTNSNFFGDSATYTYDAAAHTATIDASCYLLSTDDSQDLPAPLHFELKLQDGVWDTVNYSANRSNNS